MKKRFMSIGLALVVLLSATSCTKNVPDNTRASEWDYFYFPNTDWGMTKQELFDALDKEESEFTYDDIGTSEDIRPRYVIEQVVFGEKLNLLFDFMNSLTSDTPRLIGVQVIYSSGFTEDKSKDIMKKLDELFKKQGVAVSEEWVRTDSNDNTSIGMYKKQSVARMTSLPQVVYDGYNDAVRKIYQSGEYKLPKNDDVENTDFIKVANRNLSSVTVFRDGEKNSGFVQLGASAVVEVSEYIKFGEQK